MKLLITADIHQTDNPRDSYRFGLWEWLSEQQKRYKPDATLILGDLTDAKDKHSSVLVNSFIDGLMILKPPIFILKGNHDFIDPNNPFFKFLNEIDGIYFITEPERIATSPKLTPESNPIYMIPHQPNQNALDSAFNESFSTDIVFMHQTVTGAISETGQQLTGLSVPPNRVRAIYSGDIHVPHRVDSVTYIGSPYHVHFGDNFVPRILLLEVGKELTETNLYYPAPRKFHLQIRDISEIPELREGDQVKITMELTPAEVVEWANHKKILLEFLMSKGVHNYGIMIKKQERKKRPRLETAKAIGKSKTEYFTLFCNNEKLAAPFREAGLALVGESR